MVTPILSIVGQNLTMCTEENLFVALKPARDKPLNSDNGHSPVWMERGEARRTGCVHSVH